jgi:hypothetical protein
MEELLTLLNDLEKDDSVIFSKYVDSSLTESIQVLACSVLIDNEGKPVWDAIDTLSLKGYPVFPLERDRFGWIMGGIGTSKGIVAYG